MAPQRYGLIGHPLTHSFSKKYFTEKFLREGLSATHQYELFDLPALTALPALLQAEPQLRGLNVTIPHKQAVIPYLSGIDPLAERIGAVNVLKIGAGGLLYGYNSDYAGFRGSLQEWAEFQERKPEKALLFGDGGATRAVRAVLEDLGIACQTVSRRKQPAALLYENLTPAVLAQHRLLINATPLGTFPDTATAVPLPYDALTPRHLLYDLVYNPAETLFMQQGRARGAAVHNGLRMLELQAEAAWQLWHKA